jgi:hypothetical protein
MGKPCLSTLHESPLQLRCSQCWAQFIACFCLPFCVARGQAPELFEPIEEALSTGAFLLASLETLTPERS